MSQKLNDFANGFQRWVLPKLLFLGLAFAVFFVCWSWLAPAFLNVVGHTQDTDNKFTNSVVTVRFPFDTRDTLTAAPVMIEAGALSHPSSGRGDLWRYKTSSVEGPRSRR